MSETYKKIDANTVEVSVRPESSKYRQSKRLLQGDRQSLLRQKAEIEAEIVVIDAKLAVVNAAVIP